MATLSKRKIPIKRSDLKKAIISKNEALKRSNESFTVKNKALQSDIKSLEKLSIQESNLLESSKNKVKYQKSLLSKLEDEYKVKDNKLESVSVKISEYHSEENKMVENIADLKTQTSKLNIKVNSLKVATDDYSTMAKDMEDMEVKMLNYKDDTAKLKSSNTRYKKINTVLEEQNDSISKKLETNRISISMADEKMKAELEIKKKDISMQEVELNKTIISLNKDINLKNVKLDELDSMTLKSEEEFSKVEKKLNIARNNILEEEDRIEKVKKNFEKWKVTAVEELARMKLRGRMKNIDKAGLKDVLS